MRPTRPPSAIRNLIVAVLFVLLSAGLWLAVNDFDIAREEGFDPLRYEYYARADLPEYLADSSSYTIVLLLKLLYQYFPVYAGFLIFVIACAFFVLSADHGTALRSATISPIAFFYIAQTGKDGIAILALAAIAIISIRPRFSSFDLILFPIIAIAILIRPALVLFLPLTFATYRFGLSRALILAIAVAGVFLLTGGGGDSLTALEGVVSDEGSGALAQLGREATFGYTPAAIFGRSIILFVSPFIQPLGSVLKFTSGADLFVLFEGACQLIFLLLLIQHQILGRFLICSLPFIMVVATVSPFYHFRYMAILYPVIFAYAAITRGGQNPNFSPRILGSAINSR